MKIITLKHVYIQQLMNLQRYMYICHIPLPVALRPPLLIHLRSSCFFCLKANIHKNYMYSAKLLILKTPENYYGSSFQIHVLDNVEHDALFDCACT